ncbi:MAG: PTS IIA-like nitrogen regulatory protein PtsN [Rhizobiales bacterium]|nr:PTS IIA-like nitrogen regulatory protein PtsN [Hyphomicrobiales bacterium]
MEISDILTAKDVIASLDASSKKQALQELANHAANATGLPGREIFNTLLQRERLGSTGIGHSIAIPHAKLEGIDKIHAVFARLSTPIEFDAVDNQPVDLLFLLIAPVGAGADHLKALSRVTRLLRDAELTTRLRSARDAVALHSVLTEPHPASNAA